MDYVLRTINIIENLSVTKVIGLVMFPLKYKNAWAKQKEKMELVPQVNLQKKVSEVHEYTNINVYVAGRDEKEICQTIIDYF